MTHSTVTSFISAVRKLLGRPAHEAKATTSSRAELSYTIYWTKMARAWDQDRRAEVASELARVLARPDFAPNEFQRRYPVPGLDDRAHSGQSLLALQKVLRAFDAAREL